MGLVAHYKLDGNANDALGKYNGTPSNVTWVDGKLGKAGSFNGTNAHVTTDLFNNELLNKKSISLWVKPNSTGSQMFAAFGTNTGNRRAYLSIYNSKWDIGIERTSWGGGSIAVTLGKWVNIVIILDNGVANMLVDGESTRTISYTNYRFLAGLRIGSRDDGKYWFDGLIDDVRVYDHALSEREIRDLAQARVLHYDFDHFQEPTENVITNTDLGTGWSTNYNKDILWGDFPPPYGVDSQVVSVVDSDGDGSGYWICYGDYAPQNPNTTYTVSVYARTVGAAWSIRAYTADNSETGRQYTNTVVVPGDGNWHRIVFDPFTTPSNTTSDSLSFKFQTIPANQRCWLCAPQMEAKPYATPFVDGTRTGIIRDSSSQGNDAPLELANTPKWVEGGMVGRGCYLFDGSGTTDGTITGNYISVNPDITDTRKYPDGVTYSFWLNIDEDSVDRQSLFFGFSVLLHIEIYSASRKFRTEAAANGYSFGSSTFPNPVRGRWSHFSIVFATSEPNRPVRWYQDGVLFSTNQLGTDYFWFKEIGRSTGTPSYLYAKSLKGKLDDLRIYATALSADEVKELYQTRASIDNESNLHVYESDEVSGDTSGISSQGLAKFTSINEVGRPVRYIRDWLNGSTSNSGNHWVEIQAIDPSGTNVARGKSSSNALLTDGSTATSPYYHAGSGHQSVTVDLGDAYNITYLHIWHYWSGGRTYHKTKTEVSTDGTNWVTVFDSALEGEYPETSGGKKILLYPDKVSIDGESNIYINEILEN